MVHPTKIICLAFSVICAAGSQSTAVSPEIFQTVPEDCLAAYFIAQPGDDPKNASQSSLESATFWMQRAADMGFLSGLDATWRAWIDSLGLTAVILKHPHAITLLNISAEPRADGGHQLSELSAALIIHTNGNHAAIEQRIQHMLNSYTNSTESRLAVEPINGQNVLTLGDNRLAPWAVVQWGPVAPYYLITIGKGAFEKTARTINRDAPAIGASKWFAQAANSVRASNAHFVGYLDFDRVHKNGDPDLQKKITNVQSALRLNDARRAVLALSFEGRAVSIVAFANRGTHNDSIPLTFHGQSLAFIDTVVPPTATWYLPLDLEPHVWTNCIWNAYLASKSPDAQQHAKEAWGQLEKAAGISIEKDIFAHLGRGIIVHNYPPHVLNLPFAWTRLVKVSGDVAALRGAVDKLFGVWQQWLVQLGTVQLRRADDGLWFVHFGIEGPAFAVTDQWVIIGFSPQAVRENIAYIANQKTLQPTSP